MFRMRCDACRIFLIDFLQTVKFISPIEQSINRKRWEKYSSEISEYCLEFVTIFSKIQYDDLYNKIRHHINPLDNNISEGTFVNILLNMDRIFQEANTEYKSLKNHVFTTIQERIYLPIHMTIELEIIWLICLFNFIVVYDQIHTANKSHIKN